MNLTPSETLALTMILDMIDVYGEPVVNEELVILAAKLHKPVPKILKWTNEDIALLKLHYSEQGTNIPELRKKFTSKQISDKAWHFNLATRSHTKNKWSPYQTRLLKEKYAENGTEIPELLVDFSRSQIKTHAYRLGLRKVGIWSADDVQLLKDNYAEHGANIPSLQRKYSINQIIACARKLGLVSKIRNSWGDADIKILIAKYPTCGANIPELLSRYDKSNIRAKANALKLSVEGRKPKVTFTENEIELLKKDYPIYGTEIPSLLKSHDAAAIRAKANQLGLHYDASLFKQIQTYNTSE